MPSPHPTLLAPSVLAGDHACLAPALETAVSASVQWLHLDIMDGHFVPNLSFGPQTVAALRKRDDSLYFDTHLMLANPDQHIEAFIKAGSNNVTVHVEPKYDVAGTLRHIRELGAHRGIALNPGTPAKAVRPYLHEVELVLVMTVWPGFGGQSFIEDTLEKMRQLDRWRAEDSLAFRLEVDGGIDLATAPRCRACGVDTLVAGTAFFKASDPAAFRRAIEAPLIEPGQAASRPGS